MMNLAIIALYSYLLGAIPSAYIIGKIKGKDITSEGSGNIGGTNAYRVLGAKLGIVVFLMDMSKVVLALLLTRNFFVWESGLFVAALAAVVGHNWSVYVRFKGGKGIAVTIGTYFFLFPGLAALAGIVAILNVLITRFVSLGSLNFTLVMAALLFLTEQMPLARVMGILLLLMAIYRHRSNIRQLMTGNERRFGEKKAS